MENKKSIPVTLWFIFSFSSKKDIKKKIFNIEKNCFSCDFAIDRIRTFVTIKTKSKIKIIGF